MLRDDGNSDFFIIIKAILFAALVVVFWILTFLFLT